MRLHLGAQVRLHKKCASAITRLPWIYKQKFRVDFLTCEFGSRGTKIRRLKVIVDILYKRLHNFSNFITDTTIGFCSSGLGQILLQILNPKLIALSTTEIRPFLLSQAASTLQLLTFVHHSSHSGVNHVNLALSLFALPLEICEDEKSKYEIDICFKVAANYLLVLIDSAQRDELNQATVIIIILIKIIIKIIIIIDFFVTKNE